MFLECSVGLSGRSRSVKDQGGAVVMPEEENQTVDGGKPLEEEDFFEGRMDIESMDYQGSGANSRHDPKSPGKP
ncbi:hypothetical protein HPP92_014367 [Vanilla planifolia]|uniref:Uncharacterized protein n=1 Tax=Vanilla planifolia TaxID=51239 RepID=A0A835QUT2_VANPL|nr:hypothetical protein HPP92_014367 [Vanilla planifolia]